MPYALAAAGAASILIGSFDAARSLLATLPARSWPATHGTVVSTGYDIEPFSGPIVSGHRYVPILRYRYDVIGRSHTGDTAWLGTKFHTRSLAAMRQFLKNYPQGRSVAVRYDPDDPKRSAIFVRPRFDGLALVGIGGFFLSLGSITRRLYRIGKDHRNIED